MRTWRVTPDFEIIHNDYSMNLVFCVREIRGFVCGKLVEVAPSKTAVITVITFGKITKTPLTPYLVIFPKKLSSYTALTKSSP